MPYRAVDEENAGRGIVAGKVVFVSLMVMLVGLGNAEREEAVYEAGRGVRYEIRTERYSFGMPVEWMYYDLVRVKGGGGFEGRAEERRFGGIWFDVRGVMVALGFGLLVGLVAVWLGGVCRRWWGSELRSNRKQVLLFGLACMIPLVERGVWFFLIVPLVVVIIAVKEKSWVEAGIGSVVGGVGLWFGDHVKEIVGGYSLVRDGWREVAGDILMGVGMLLLVTLPVSYVLIVALGRGNDEGRREEG